MRPGIHQIATGLTVLAVDKDFDLIATITGQAIETLAAEPKQLATASHFGSEGLPVANGAVRGWLALNTDVNSAVYDNKLRDLT